MRALPLPSGASTAAAQIAQSTYLASIDTKAPALVNGRVPTDGSSVTQPVSAASLPLPSGAATAALQSTCNTSLSSIDGKIPALSGGRIPVDASGTTQPVSMATLPRGSSYTRITSNTTTQIKSGSGTFRRLVIASTILATITFYDSTTGSGTVIYGFAGLTLTPMTLEIDAAFSTGLTVVTSGSGCSITIIWD